jgi:hypothetical protein
MELEAPTPRHLQQRCNALVRPLLLLRRWMENIRDWCVSRQLWWGHRIPAFYVELQGGWAVLCQWYCWYCRLGSPSFCLVAPQHPAEGRGVACLGSPRPIHAQPHGDLSCCCQSAARCFTRLLS